ncbi:MULTISPECIES: hypothetical protein [Aliagarivorans]|uniref:AbiTii domain-containing protein n=1 Tax=Aliagarivorans TaxID=882379 RepID=UPI000417BB83|nr:MULTISPECIES: hypothetical protein [Aliagarivorans]
MNQTMELAPRHVEPILSQAIHLAEQYQLDDIASWLKHELGGYGDFADYPDYRLLDCQLFGIFLKDGSDQQHFEEIHSDCLSERDRGRLCHLYLRRPMAYYLEKPREIKRNWPTSILASYSRELIPGYRCIQAWQSHQAPIGKRLVDGALGHLWHLARGHHEFCDKMERLLDLRAKPLPYLIDAWHHQSHNH